MYQVDGLFWSTAISAIRPDMYAGPIFLIFMDEKVPLLNMDLSSEPFFAAVLSAAENSSVAVRAALSRVFIYSPNRSCYYFALWTLVIFSDRLQIDAFKLRLLQLNDILYHLAVFLPAIPPEK